MIGGLGSSRKTPGFPEKVLGKMLGDIGGVLGGNICGGGILKCQSLTRRCVPSRQQRRGKRKVVGVRLGCMSSSNPSAREEGNPLSVFVGSHLAVPRTEANGSRCVSVFMGRVQGSGPLKQAKDEVIRLDQLRKAGEDPRLLKS